MKKNISFAVVALLVSVVVWFGLRQSRHHDENVIVVGTNANFAPFEFKKNGELVGFDIDLMEAIAQRIGKKIEWKDTEFTSLLLEAQTGQINAIASAMTPTPERSQRILFLPTYLEHDPLIVITLKRGLVPRALADLKDKDVIVNEGYTAESFMEKQGGFNLKRIGSVAEAFMNLDAGRGDAFVSARSATQAYFDRVGIERYNIMVLEHEETYALAVSKKYPELHATMKKAYDQLVADGTLQKLRKKWHLEWV